MVLSKNAKEMLKTESKARGFNSIVDLLTDDFDDMTNAELISCIYDIAFDVISEQAEIDRMGVC